MPQVQQKATTKRLVAIGASLIILGLGAFTTTQKLQNEQTSSSESLTDMVLNRQYFNEKVLQGNDVTNRIAVIRVNGVIQDNGSSSLISGSEGYQHQQVIEQFKAAAKDSTVKGILLAVDSPGGGVYESAELRAQIQKVREETNKPIYTSFGSVSASGGYYISAETDRIYAAEETTTGSIGVIMGSYDFSQLMENIGVKQNVIKSGEMKDIMSSTRSMTKEEKEVIQTYLNNAFERFLEIVMNGRGMSKEEVLKVADGRVFDGRQAVENGLVDEIGYEADAIKGLAEKIAAENPVVFEYVAKDTSFFSNYLPFGLNFKGNQDLTSQAGQVWSFIEAQQSPTAQYIYRGGH